MYMHLQSFVDACTQADGVQPAPENNIAIGVTFDKYSPYNYKANCDTYRDSFTSPGDCQWDNCHLPSSARNTAKCLMD